MQARLRLKLLSPVPLYVSDLVQPDGAFQAWSRALAGYTFRPDAQSDDESSAAWTSWPDLAKGKQCSVRGFG